MILRMPVNGKTLLHLLLIMHIHLTCLSPHCAFIPTYLYWLQHLMFSPSCVIPLSWCSSPFSFEMFPSDIPLFHLLCLNETYMYMYLYHTWCASPNLPLLHVMCFPRCSFIITDNRTYLYPTWCHPLKWIQKIQDFSLPEFLDLLKKKILNQARLFLYKQDILTRNKTLRNPKPPLEVFVQSLEPFNLENY